MRLQTVPWEAVSTDVASSEAVYGTLISWVRMMN